MDGVSPFGPAGIILLYKPRRVFTVAPILPSITPFTKPAGVELGSTEPVSFPASQSPPAAPPKMPTPIAPPHTQGFAPVPRQAAAPPAAPKIAPKMQRS